MRLRDHLDLGEAITKRSRVGFNICQIMKLLLICLLLPFANGNRILTTTNGPVRGTSLSTKNVEAFLGIPYAEPPVGPLRFARPVPKSSWSETFDATKLAPTCVQVDSGQFDFSPNPAYEMTEDCLYLNVWVPKGGCDMKTIMLFIHGGSLTTGSSNSKIYDGAALSEQGDVIVVTINYRLGTLGFFSDSTEDAPGSMGMYDQVMAIQWIKDNAENFGGDPNNIVLFGESSGGFSITLHLISPLSRNLFKRAIIQSGTALTPLFNRAKNLTRTSQKIASYLGCANEEDSLQKNPKAVVDCMKTLPPEKFREADNYAFLNSLNIIPTTGDEFLPENSIDSFKKGHYKDTEVLIGVNRDEGSLLLVLGLSGLFGVFGEKADSLNETDARQYFESLANSTNYKEEVRDISEVYLERVKKEHGYTYLKATVDFVSDFVITCSALFEADYHSLKYKPVYFYMFDYRPDSTPLADWMGVTHFDEVQYVFGNSPHQNFTEYEKEFSRHVMDIWTTFAKTGNPSVPGCLRWPRYTYQNPKYVVIGERESIRVRPDSYRCELWRETFEAVIDQDSL